MKKYYGKNVDGCQFGIELSIEKHSKKNIWKVSAYSFVREMLCLPKGISKGLFFEKESKAIAALEDAEEVILRGGYTFICSDCDIEKLEEHKKFYYYCPRGFDSEWIVVYAYDCDESHRAAIAKINSCVSGSSVVEFKLISKEEAIQIGFLPRKKDGFSASVNYIEFCIENCGFQLP